ncbi:unnamed protein product [Adineta steineri]|uniref:NAD(P)(+)--arginine ADP-ribosyltransferase n=1 Tax=Adineta steineri TaxID=433720 RepID=A0A813QP29_9BILA|nr:unnamed protein product [Adineta steineri]CAF0769720.1 unnamed protein product [Adineta steineri]
MSSNTEEKNVRNTHEDRMGTNVYSADDNKSMHKSLNGEFILYQILLERILSGQQQLKSNEQSLLKYFQPDEKSDKEIMTEFDQTYHPTKAIYWYTRESCIYKILNKALRTQNTEEIVPFGPFIKDLNMQLSQEHKEFTKQQQSPTIQVYRGQFISKDEMNRLKSGQGQLISTNSFLSTSTNRNKALEFALSKPPPNDELTTVLLEIDVDLRALSKPYADIKNLSAFKEEEEILFMIACVFRIDKVNYDEETKLWMAKFILCSENDSDMKKFTENITKELKGQNHLISIGNSLVDMQKFDDAQKHFENILKNQQINDPIDYAYAHHGLAKVYEKKGNHQLAVENFDIALNYLSKSSAANDHPLFSQCYNQLGLIYSSHLKNSDKAFESFEKALNTSNESLAITYSGLANAHFLKKNYQISLEYLQKALDNSSNLSEALQAGTFIEMGKVYTAMNKQEKASEMFDKANQLQAKDLSPTHPDIGYTYTALGLMHSDHGNQHKALEFIEKAHQLQLETLPSNHPDLAETYQNFGDLYLKQASLDKALHFYKKKLEIQLKTLSLSNPSVVETYDIIGNVYLKKKDFKQASIYFHKSLDGQLETKKVGDLSLSKGFETLADIHLDQHNEIIDEKILDKALDYYLQSLQNQLETKFLEDYSLIDLYKIIAKIYYKKRYLDQSLLYYNRLLDCYLRKSPLNQINIDNTYKLIEKVYLKKHHFNQSLSYFNNHRRNLSENQFEHIDNIHFEKRHLDHSSNYFQDIVNKQLLKYPEKSANLNNIYYILANIYYEKQYFHHSLKYFLQLLKNQSEDFSLGNLYKAIATIYFQIENWEESLIYFYKLIQYQLQSQTTERSAIDDTYELIGKVYLKFDYSLNELSKKKENLSRRDSQIDNYYLDQSLAYFQNLLNTRNKIYSFAEIHRIIANIYLKKQNFNQALFHCQTSLDNQLKHKPKGNVSIAQLYFIMGDIHRRQGSSNYALKAYKKALHICQRVDSHNHGFIDNIQNRIRLVLTPAI